MTTKPKQYTTIGATKISMWLKDKAQLEAEAKELERPLSWYINSLLATHPSRKAKSGPKT